MKKIKIIVPVFSILLLVFCSFSRSSNGYEPGDKAISFKLKNVDGKMVSPSDYENAKGFIIVFTCNHCPFAKAYEERIIALNKQFESSGYPVIAINPNDPEAAPEDSYENMQERAKIKEYRFPYLMDESQEIAKAYGAAHTPHVFVLKKESENLIVKYVGAIDDNSDDPSAVTKRYVEDAVNALIGGKTVQVPLTKAIGCSIKWKKA